MPKKWLQLKKKWMSFLFQIFSGPELAFNSVSHGVYIVCQHFFRIILLRFFFECNCVLGARLLNLSNRRFASDRRNHLYERPTQCFPFLLNDAIPSYSYRLIPLSLCWLIAIFKLVPSCSIPRCLSLTLLSLVVSPGLVIIERGGIDGLLMKWLPIGLTPI